MGTEPILPGEHSMCIVSDFGVNGPIGNRSGFYLFAANLIAEISHGSAPRG